MGVPFWTVPTIPRRASVEESLIKKVVVCTPTTLVKMGFHVLFVTAILNDFFCAANRYFIAKKQSQPAFTCSKLIIETLEQGVKYVQS